MIDSTFVDTAFQWDFPSATKTVPDVSKNILILFLFIFSLVIINNFTLFFSSLLQFIFRDKILIIIININYIHLFFYIMCTVYIFRKYL